MTPEKYQNDDIKMICADCSDLAQPEEAYCYTTCPLTIYLAVRRRLLAYWDVCTKPQGEDIYESVIAELELEWKSRQTWTEDFVTVDCHKCKECKKGNDEDTKVKKI